MKKGGERRELLSLEREEREREGKNGENWVTTLFIYLL